MRLGALANSVSVTTSWLQSRLNTIIGSRRTPVAVDGVLGPQTLSALMYYLNTILGVNPTTGLLFDGRIYQFEAVTNSRIITITVPLKEALANGVGADGSRPSTPRTPAPTPPDIPATREDIPEEYRSGSGGGYSSGASSGGMILLAVGVVGAVYFYSRMQRTRPRGLRGVRARRHRGR